MLNFYKSHESELIEVDNARVVGPTDRYGELYVTTKPNVDRTPRGGMIYPSYSDRDTGLLDIAGLPTVGGPSSPSQFGDTPVPDRWCTANTAATRSTRARSARCNPAASSRT
ncbi:MAG TPA: hypothetical protein VG247_26855 [Pseudonocardiaceae bacterium]|nr:hypothetical protein [Pseudonocardiaceae bacterium]